MNQIYEIKPLNHEALGRGGKFVIKDVDRIESTGRQYAPEGKRLASFYIDCMKKGIDPTQINTNNSVMMILGPYDYERIEKYCKNNGKLKQLEYIKNKLQEAAMNVEIHGLESKL